MNKATKLPKSVMSGIFKGQGRVSITRIVGHHPVYRKGKVDYVAPTTASREYSPTKSSYRRLIKAAKRSGFTRMRFPAIPSVTKGAFTHWAK